MGWLPSYEWIHAIFFVYVRVCMLKLPQRYYDLIIYLIYHFIMLLLNSYVKQLAQLAQLHSWELFGLINWAGGPGGTVPNAVFITKKITLTETRVL